MKEGRTRGATMGAAPLGAALLVMLGAALAQQPCDSAQRELYNECWARGYCSAETERFVASPGVESPLPSPFRADLPLSSLPCTSTPRFRTS